MQPFRKIQNIAHSIAQYPRRISQYPRHLALAGLTLIGGGAGAVVAAPSAGATGNNGYGHPTTTTTEVEECGTGTEMPQCTTTTTAPPSTTTSTTAPPSTTTSTSTTTTEPPTTTSTSTTTSTTVPAPSYTCADFEKILDAEVETDPTAAYWNAIYKFSDQYHLEYDAAVHFVQEDCGYCPPEPTTTTTTAPPSTTTSTSTTTTTAPPSTTTSTSTTTTTAPPSTSTTSTTVAPSTSTTVAGPTTTAAPAQPVTPLRQGELPRTGVEADLLIGLGGTGVITGSGLVVVAARSKTRNAVDKIKGKEVASGGPDPVDPNIADDIAVVSEPLTGEEIDATDFDALADKLTTEKDTTLYFDGDNRDDAMKGNTKYSNVPDALLPAALRKNPDQTSPVRPIVAEIAPIVPEVAPVVRDTFEGYKFAPSRFTERGF